MNRARCAMCARDARYRADIGLDDSTGAGDWANLCGRHAVAYAHAGAALSAVGTCGHIAEIADMVARRPCEGCRGIRPVALRRITESDARRRYESGRRIAMAGEPDWFDVPRAGHTFSRDEMRVSFDGLRTARGDARYSYAAPADDGPE